MKRYIALGLLIIVLVLGIVFHYHQKPKVDKPIVYNGTYIALGDSVSAGDGLQNYSDSSACNRSNQSYPYLISKNLNLQLHNLSCSGATLSAGLNGPQNVNRMIVTSQLDQLNKLPKPKLITITAGANDVGWIENIASCYKGNCGNQTETNFTNAKIANLSNSLSLTLNNIASTYKNKLPIVVVTSYYSPFPASFTSCADMTNLNQSSLDWLNNEEIILNDQLESITKNFQFVKFVKLDYSGHELCSSNPWVQGLTDNAPYHPNTDGQKYIAHRIQMTYVSN